jgi:dTDP-4-dehydrorhamnose reductase
MRILILGAGGQVGVELMRAHWDGQAEITGLARSDLDITDEAGVAAAFSSAEPQIVVNAAAYTAVDQAETDTARAFAVNAEGPMLLARECRRRGIPLVHLSTDYVFDGAATRPYREGDPIRPINVYGRSKAEGEAAVRELQPEHIIVRTAWVYASHGSNFVRTMLRLARERDQVSVVADQQGSPTAAAAIAAAIVQIVQQVVPQGRQVADAAWGTYHFTAQGETTWHGFAERILDGLARTGERRPMLKPIAAADYPSQTMRPAYSVLDCALIERTFGIIRPGWEEGLDRVLRELLPDAGNLARRYGGMR